MPTETGGSMEDSLEKIEREMREIKVGRGQVGYDAATQADRAFAHFADRLRALRERDEKRMERDQAFIQAAIRYFHLMSEGHDPALLVVDWEKLDSPPTVLDLALAAYRVRREGMKDGA